MRVYTGSAWQALPTLPDLTVEKSFKATAGQTSYTFTGGYRVNFTYVWVNGALLYSDEYTATNGSTITFTTALTLDDEVRILTFKAVGSVTAADVGALPTTGGTMTGNITFNGGQTFPGTGDVAGQASSVDNEIALFSGTGGKTIKRATTTGVLKASSGVIAAAVAGTDYVSPGGALGTPSSGTLTNCTVDGTNELGFKNIPQNSQSAAYTLVLADSGKHILHPSADTTARTFTIPANSSVAFSVGTAITFINQNGAGVVTIAITTDTMRLAGAGTTGSRTLAANGVATAIKITSTEWIISGSGLT